MIKTCAECGDRYQTDFSWSTMCKECYIESKKKERNDLEDRLRYCREQASQFREQARQWQERAESAEAQIKAMKGLDADMLRRLIQLAHPDKHGNSESSKIATQWLIKARGIR